MEEVVWDWERGSRVGVSILLPPPPTPPPVKASLGPLLPSSGETNHRGSPLQHLKQNIFFLILHLNVGWVWKQAWGRSITQMWLGQWPSVEPLALGKLHNSELQGNGKGHWVPPNFHTSSPEAEGVWRKGLHSLPCRFPHLLPVSLPAGHPHLDIY